MSTARCSLTAALLVALPACGGGEEPVEDPDTALAEIRNGIAMDERHVGGGQPSMEVLAGLAERGYSMVVNLRLEGEDHVDEERAIVEGAGMQYAYVPIGGADFTADDARALRAALDRAPSDASRVLVHCGSGSRVGALWATMHGLEMGLTGDQAVELAEESGKVRANSLDRVREVVASEGGHFEGDGHDH